MFKIAEAFKRIDEEENARDYIEDLPSLNATITKMIKSERYVFSADFLARGYPFENGYREDVAHLLSPSRDHRTDVALCLFKNNPQIGDHPEQPGIWRSDTDDRILIPLRN